MQPKEINQKQSSAGAKKSETSEHGSYLFIIVHFLKW